MKTNYFIKTALSILLIMLLLFSCKKEKPQISGGDVLENLEWQNSTCNLTEPAIPAINGTTALGNQYKYPVFNPNNSYEIAYYKIVKDSGSAVAIDHQIVKYNLLYKQETVLLTGTEITGPFAWNKDGWIALKKRGTPIIYIMKEDGSQLTNFAYNVMTGANEYDFNLTWLKQGNTLLYGRNQGPNQSYLQTQTIGDATVKYIPIDNSYYGIDFAVSTKNILISPMSESFLNFYITDINPGVLSTTSLYVNGLQGTILGGINWHPDGSNFYISFYENGGTANLYEINYLTGSKTKLVESCNFSLIQEAIYVPFGDYLLLQKLERDVIGEPGTIGDIADIIENSSIWLFDLKTKKEARLFK